jgi:hypothetical protein
MQQLNKTRVRCALIRTGFVRGALAASSAAALVVAASTFAAQPGRAESAAQSKSDECLARPKGAPPRGSHWFYRRDRSTGKRCWFLGPESMRVRRSEPAPRRAAAEIPSPPPRERPLSRPADASAPEAPPAVASTPNAAVAATQFSALWPPASSAPSSGNRTAIAVGNAAASPALKSAASTNAITDATPTSDAPAQLASNDAAADNATANLAAVVPGNDAAARSSAPPPALSQLLIFFAASAAFVAIAFRMTLKLSSALLGRRRRRVQLRPEPTFVRPPAPVRPPFDYGARTARAPEWLRPHVPAMHTAMQLESIERPLRRPLVADDPPLQVDEMPPLRRRAVA